MIVVFWESNEDNFENCSNQDPVKDKEEENFVEVNQITNDLLQREVKPVDNDQDREGFDKRRAVNRKDVVFHKEVKEKMKQIQNGKSNNFDFSIAFKEVLRFDSFHRKIQNVVLYVEINKDHRRIHENFSVRKG